MHRSISLTVVAVALTVLSTSVAANADNWAQWRGGAFNGSSPETNLPTKIGPDQGVGRRLIENGLAHLKASGVALVFVLGFVIALVVVGPVVLALGLVLLIPLLILGGLVWAGVAVFT